MEKIKTISVYDKIQDHLYFRDKINKIIIAVNELQDRFDGLSEQVQKLSKK